MDSTSKTARVLAALVALGALMVLFVAPAGAFRGHVFGRDFGWGVSDGKAEAEICSSGCKPGVAGSGAGQFSNPSDVAVNDATGHVYVLDQGNSRIEVFDHEGHYLLQFTGSETPATTFAFGSVALTGGIAVDNSCHIKKLAGSACTTADPSNGAVYVTDPGHRVVDKFGPEGKYLSQLEQAKGGTPFEATGLNEWEHPAGVSVDSSGIVWVYQGKVGYASGEVASFTNSEPSVLNSERQLENLPGFVCPGFAVDAEDDFYVRKGGGGCASGEVFKFATSGKNSAGQGSEAPFAAGEASAVAVDLSSGEVFLDNVSSVGAFTSGGVEQERFGLGDLVGGAGLAVEHESSTDSSVFVSDGAAGRVVVSVPEPPGPPLVVGESVAGVTAGSARLQAEVNPRGASTEYHFEYGPCGTPATCAASPYGESSPVPGGLTGSDFEVRGVSANPQDLVAGTTYHFRVLASNGEGGGVVVVGQEQTFTTQPAGVFELPDDREWELVSPPDKHGALLEAIAESGVAQAAAAGNGMTYLADAPTETEPEGNGNKVQVLSTRGPGGWSSRDITPAHESATGKPVGPGAEYRFFSSDLSLGVLQPFGAFTRSLSPLASEQAPFLHTDYLGGHVGEPCVHSCFQPLVSGCPQAGEPCPALVEEHADVPAGTLFGEEGHCPPVIVCGPVFEGASADASHIVLSSTPALTATPVRNGLYEWAEGKLALVSVLPAGEGGTPVGGALAGERGAVSGDGSRVVWRGGGGKPHLYLRDRVSEETVRLDPGLVGEPEFQDASADGGEVFFTESGDLYEYDLQERVLKRLTVGGGVLGALVGVSGDGSYVYFVADGVLAQGAVAGTCVSGKAGPSPGGAMCDLYVFHGGVVRLVAVLSGADNPDWLTNLWQLTARVSPDGRWLAFMSQRELTGYDNRDAASGKPDEEVYLYDAEHERVLCASCNPTGARPVGVEYGKLGAGSGVDESLVGGYVVWERDQWLAANVPGWTPYALGRALYQSRYLSDSGRLFFNSAEALVPQDVNGTWDVYEWEPPGVGSCTTASVTYGERSGGCVALVSSGSSPEESAFLDASESGGDVFFLTAAALSTQDRDTSLDVYDAHECPSRAPCVSVPAASPGECLTEASCRAAPSPQPGIFGAPASATFSGAGNPVTPPPGLKPLSVAQKRAQALRVCAKKYRHAKKRRVACEHRAKARYAKTASGGGGR